MLIAIALAHAIVSSPARAAEHPCEAVKKACEAAGFVKGEAKDGTGLWKDCIEPLVQGKAQPANAKKPLPVVDAAVVAACKAKHALKGH